MNKKINLKVKKDKKRKIRECRSYRKRHYKETVDYALDCLMKEWC